MGNFYLDLIINVMITYFISVLHILSRYESTQTHYTLRASLWLYLLIFETWTKRQLIIHNSKLLALKLTPALIIFVAIISFCIYKTHKVLIFYKMPYLEIHQVTFLLNFTYFY
jgi:hypothetical protein